MRDACHYSYYPCFVDVVSSYVSVKYFSTAHDELFSKGVSFVHMQIEFKTPAVLFNESKIAHD